VCMCVCIVFLLERRVFFLLAKKKYASTFDLVGENRSVCVCIVFFVGKMSSGRMHVLFCW
jgi:hypothetical protein